MTADFLILLNSLSLLRTQTIEALVANCGILKKKSLVPKVKGTKNKKDEALIKQDSFSSLFSWLLHILSYFGNVK